MSIITNTSKNSVLSVAGLGAGAYPKASAFAYAQALRSIRGAAKRKPLSQEGIRQLKTFVGLKSELTVRAIVYAAKLALDNFLGALTLSSKPNHPMCRNYGHVIERAWKGYLPSCTDCGAKIFHPDQLRKSTLKID